MKAAFLMAVSVAGVLAISTAAHAQDMQAMPDQSNAAQLNAQSGASDSNASSYGGTMLTTKASGSVRDTWMSNPSTACTPGLSCNIYQGQ
ncbi:hypothetical protein BVER_04010 [Candidatus Burkholderia verschuerenii]|uniref:Uncharacterized protein n=1 Tax=Candidatus Burkholderia verschuerenii TaxID=242163 RepID=A0A0L0M3A5_9BURK|nr:hypothetical protein [Candidatus Burkholderia verschuerenii]KND56868.1 hypothetical protein BVER_04010 [Candidatus Burkholderia verschuerenii]